MQLIGKFKKKLFIILALCFYTSICFPSGNEKLIRIAILDNFNFQPNITNQYDKYYLAGIEAAVFAAKEKKIKIEYKIFRYSRDALAILKIVPDVNSWQPDVIIGPRNSNMFLTIRNSFKNILVISPYASSSAVEYMPKNYYSLSLPDKYMAQAISIFLKKNHPTNGLISIVEADCKNCVDISHELSSIYHNNYPKNNFNENFFLQKSVKELDIEKTLNGYKKDDVIFLPNTSYASTILMVRITNYLARPMFFLGADDWGSWRNSEVGKLKANYPYYGIRVTSWSLDSDYKLKEEFLKNFKKLHHGMPEDAVSMLAYATIGSIVSALNKYPEPMVSDIKTEILNSYMHALKNDKNWFRQSEYKFYKTDSTGDVLIDTIKLPL
ncbi:MAG: hypothetical protein P4M12_02910 [Gammaproteobacteria bacterium]|nr:hypothetical protein [Gammaproteobacteria bacterium]